MIVFSSKEPVEKMSLIQKMYLHGQLVETLLFEFGFVIPNSTNSWEQTIVADEGNVMPAEVLSGNLTCETLFYSHGVPIHKSSYRIFYDWIKLNYSTKILIFTTNITSLSASALDFWDTMGWIDLINLSLGWWSLLKVNLHAHFYIRLPFLPLCRSSCSVVLSIIWISLKAWENATNEPADIGHDPWLLTLSIPSLQLIDTNMISTADLAHRFLSNVWWSLWDFFNRQFFLYLFHLSNLELFHFFLFKSLLHFEVTSFILG